MDDLRPMTTEDVSACVDVFQRSLNGLRASLGLPAYRSSSLEDGVAHLLGTDPRGSFVVCGADGTVKGFVQAARRDELWVLAHLFVAPEGQGSGLGKKLLGFAVEYGVGLSAGMIASTPDPRAIRSYAGLDGFDVHPMLTARGVTSLRALPVANGVRPGSSTDLEFVAEIDRRLRGGAHGPDLAYHLLREARLLVLPDRGYAVAGQEGPIVLAALDQHAGRELLLACLACCVSGEPVVIKRFGAGQQWAVKIAVAAGLELRPWGPLVTRGTDVATAAYLPDSAFC